MKSQILLSGKNKKKINLSSAESGKTVVKVKLLEDKIWAMSTEKVPLTLKALRKPASENVVCLYPLLDILANFSNLFLLTGKQCGPRSDCSYRSSLIWVHTVCRSDFLK